MSRSLGTLTLDLIAKTGGFEQGMTRAQRKTKELDNDFKIMVARLDKAALALGTFAAGAAAGMVALAMQTVKTMDATSKMADQIGVTTESLTGLRFAAQQFTNVSDQTFDMALRRMTRRIEEAAQGSGGAKAAFDAMGLSAKELSRLSADEQFMRIADAMQKTDTQAQRLKNTMAIFDTEGMPLVTALVQGSEELERNIELATRYGVVLSTQAAKSAEQFSTNLSRLGKIQEGYRQQLTTALLPALERASGYMLGVAESALEVGNSRSRLEEFGQAAVDVVDDLARSYAGLVEIGRGVLDLLDDLDDAALGWLEPFKQQTQSATSILSQSFSESILNTAREIDKLVGFAGGVMAVWEAVGANIPLYFRVAWGKVLEGAAAFVNSLADLVNPMLQALRMEGFEKVTWGENVVVGLRSISDSFREGYEAAKEASGMAARVQAAYEGVGVSAASAAASLGGTNGSGGGGRNLTGSTKAAQKAAEDFRKEQQRALQSQYQSISALHDQARALEDQISVYGLGKTAIEDLNIARLEEQATILRGFDGSEEAVEAIEREIEARQRLRTAIGSLEQKEAEKASWEEWARGVDQVFQQVGQSLTDQLFDGGKRGLDMLKDWAKTLTLRLFVQPVMSGLQSMITGVGPGGVAAAGGAGSGLMSNAGSLFSMFGGNSMGMGISNVLSNLSTSNMFAGTGVGNWMMGTAGNVAGMSNLALGGAGLLGGLGADLIFGGKGHSGTVGGLGATAGMALGGPIGAVAGSLLGGAVGSLFGSRVPTTRRTQHALTQIVDGEFVRTISDSRQAEDTQEAARAYTQAAVEGANSLFEQIGSSARIDQFYSLMESSILGDRQGVASGGYVNVGGESRMIGLDFAVSDRTRGGVGGWTEAEMWPRLQTDIQLSLLEAFQVAGDGLPQVLSGMLEGIDIRSLGAEQAAALAATFQGVIDGVTGFQAAIEQLPFANLRDLSFDAAANLISFAGGLEQLDAGMTSYFQNFYSEAEQIEWMTDQMSASLSELGFEMPDLSLGADAAKASLRSFVEGLDVTQEEGARAFAGVMNLAGSYAELAAASEELANKTIEDARRAAEETQRIAERVASERYSLETQLLQLQGDTITLRMRELDTIDAANRGLQQQIWTLQDAAAAQQAYENSINSVTNSLAGIRETVLLDQLGTDDARYDYFKAQADGLARLIPQLEDQDAITRAMNQINSLTTRAYGTLDKDQKVEMGGEFLSYLNRTEDLALQQMQAINESNRQASKEQAQENAKATADAVAEGMRDILNAMVRVVSDSGEVSKQTIAALQKIADNSGRGVSGQPYPEVRNSAEVNA